MCYNQDTMILGIFEKYGGLNKEINGSYHKFEEETHKLTPSKLYNYQQIILLSFPIFRIQYPMEWMKNG